jgi:hypothetical protein
MSEDNHDGSQPVGRPEEEVAPQEVSYGLCELAECDLELPAPAVDADGRRKGGRRPKYCSKAHADEASRRRRTAADAAVSQPLRNANEIAERITPAARDLRAELTALLEQLERAESGALARIEEAERDVAETRRERNEAESRTELAERRAGTAQAQARDDREGRKSAERDAETARHDADRRNRAAAEEIAEHERARGQAEGALTAAERTRDELAARLRAAEALLVQERAGLQAQIGRLRTEKDELADRLALSEAGRASAREQALTALAEVREARAATTAAERDTARVRDEAAERVSVADHAAALAEQARLAATEEIKRLREERESALLQFNTAQAAQGFAERERDTARRDADAQRERAALAEARATAAEALARADRSADTTDTDSRQIAT